MRFGLTVKICFLFIGVLVFSLALNAFLNISNFYSTYLALAQERFRVVGDDLAAAMEYGLSLGLSLDEMDTIGRRIRQIQTDDTEILSISIVNARRVAVHDTDRKRIGAVLPESWFKTLPDGKPHHADQEGEIALAMVIPITNSFGVQEGTCLIRYSTATLLQAIMHISKEFGRFSLLVLAVLVPVASIMFYVAGRPMFRRFKRMRKQLEAMSAGNSPASSAPDDLDPDFLEFTAASQQAMNAMAGSGRTESS